MAFQSGVASSFTDLYTQLRTFVVANAGFTDGGTVTIDGRTVHSVQKGGVWWNFSETYNAPVTILGIVRNRYITFCRMTYSQPTTVFSDTVPIGQRTSTGFTSYGNNGPFTGHTFYTDGTAVHVVLEIFPNVFNHLSFGGISKQGTWVGGEYLSAGISVSIRTSGYFYENVINSQHLFADFTGVGPAFNVTGLNSNMRSYVRYVKTGNNLDDFAPLGAEHDSSILTTFEQQHALMSGPHFYNFPITTGRPGLLHEVLSTSPNTFNQRVPLLPNYLRLRIRNTSTSPHQYFYAGTTDMIRITNIGNLTPGDIVNTDWQVWPIHQISGDAFNAPVTLTMAIAIQRIP